MINWNLAVLALTCVTLGANVFTIQTRIDLLKKNNAVLTEAISILERSHRIMDNASNRWERALEMEARAMQQAPKGITLE